MRRLSAADQGGFTFKYKDYRLDGSARYKTMTLDPHEFIRRFLMHVLPKGLHRIRHYGLLANANRAANIAKGARAARRAAAPRLAIDHRRPSTPSALSATPFTGIKSP